MTDKKLNNEDRQAELIKYRDLVIATIDYYLENKDFRILTADFDSDVHYNKIKTQTEENFRKGRLTRLKQWFRDLTEGFMENGDLKFNQYLQEKTKYKTDIFKAYFERINKIIGKGKISSDSQFYEIQIMINELCQTEPVDFNRINTLNKLVSDYEARRSPRRKENKQKI